jgi:ATP phosphoribosyltransferase
MTKNILRFAIPKGSLWEVCHSLLTEAGYALGDASRNYRPSINDNDIQIKLLRPQEIPEYLQDGRFDLGISGRDWVKECRADLIEILDLEMGHVRIVFCIPNFWDTTIQSFDDFLEYFIQNDKVLRISTEYINLVTDFISQSSVYKQKFGNAKPRVYSPWQQWGENEQVKVYLSFGATEAKPPEEVDCIFDNTSTGSTIRANGLRIVETIDTSNALLLASRESMDCDFKREKINDIKLLLKGVLNARTKLHIFMNCKKENISKICSLLPALKKPTIGQLYGLEGWFAINTIVDKADFLPLIPRIKKLAQGLVVISPKQVIELI